MATNRDIVATRKLNDNRKAKLGRGGDTEIRKVDGKKSHVNALEAYLIDVDRKGGEEFAKKVGAGTINPYTGMPEYHTYEHDHTHTDPDDDSSSYWLGTGDNITDAGGNKVTLDSKGEKITAGDYVPPTGRQDYETLAGMTPEQLEAYLKKEFKLGDDSMQYIEGFDQTSLDFIEDEYGYTKEGLTQQMHRLDVLGKKSKSDYDFATEGLKSTRDFAVEGLGAERGFTLEGLEAQHGFATEGLQHRLADTASAVNRQMRGGVQASLAGAAQTASRTGLASGGTWGMQQQMKSLTQDRAEGLGRASRDYGLGQRQAAQALDFGTRRAESAYDIGSRQAESAYDIGTRQATADYGFREEDLAIDKREWGTATRAAKTGYLKSQFEEQKRQLDQLYSDVSTATTAQASDKRLKENIDYIGNSPSGIKIYEFNYLNKATRYRGVMADDLINSHPEVLSRDRDGYYMVDYSQIDVNFETIKGD